MSSPEDPSPVLIVQAVYAFKGKNNDELCFKKGDSITITQKDEGGWWEGTLDGKTGWFPSNYVKDVKGRDVKSPADPLLVEPSAEKQQAYRNLILKDVIDSERSHLADMQGLLKTVLTPLGATETLLTRGEFAQLVGNLAEIVELHGRLLAQLDECHEKGGAEQRVGRVFLAAVEPMKAAHGHYCANHPKAVCVLERHKDELGAFVEAAGCPGPGLVFLTVGLSRPFRRLERYAGSLQELERHMEESHPDRGDTQRSVSLYQQLAASCASIRRQKQQELDVLCGAVRGWEGEEAHRLGELLYMAPVKVSVPSAASCQELKDRHLVVFSQCLVVLSVSQRLSAFVYERKVPLTGATLTLSDEAETSLEVLAAGHPASDRLFVVCPSVDERQRLADLIRTSSTSTSSTPALALTPHMPMMAAIGPTTSAASKSASVPSLTPSISPASSSSSGANSNANSSSGGGGGATIATHNVGKSILRRPPAVSTGATANPPPPTLPAPATPMAAAASSNAVGSGGVAGVEGMTSGSIWSGSCLRPAPPLRSCPAPAGALPSKKKSFRKRELTYEDDVQLLQVVEAYCTTAKYRQTLKSALIEFPQVLLPDEEKLIVDETTGGVEEKSLVDTVYALRDQVRQLQLQLLAVTRDVEQLKSKNP